MAQFIDEEGCKNGKDMWSVRFPIDAILIALTLDLTPKINLKLGIYMFFVFLQVIKREMPKLMLLKLSLQPKKEKVRKSLGLCYPEAKTVPTLEVQKIKIEMWQALWHIKSL